MGYGFYDISDGRFGGYMVLATCDKFGCENEIDRGLGYLCGDNPHDFWSDEPGCGRYYCADHLGWVGDRGGCTHRRRGKAWGKTLSCMATKITGTDYQTFTDYCCDPIGHDGPHGWAKSDAA